MSRLAEEIARYGSVAVAGMAKNVGKTVTLNYLLRRCGAAGLPVGVTSIGVDGESTDAVTGTRKPEIRLSPGTVFATCEAFYRQRLIEAEVLGVSSRHTSLGRVVTARALTGGKAIIAGPADTASARRLIEEMKAHGASTVFIDGALSRVSPASPEVTEALVLATGAALSPDISRIVAATRLTWRLIRLPEAESSLRKKLLPITSGVWLIGSDCSLTDTGLESGIRIRELDFGAAENPRGIYIPGIVTDRMLKALTARKETAGLELIVRDFTKLFIGAPVLRAFLSAGGRVKVLWKARLLAVTVNPWSPSGYSVDRERLVDSLQKEIDVPVISLVPGKDF